MEALRHATQSSTGAAAAPAGPKPDPVAVAQAQGARPGRALPLSLALLAFALLLLAAETLRRQDPVALTLTLLASALALAAVLLGQGELRRLEQRQAAVEAAAAQLHEARRRAEVASAAKSAFLANMSHEIRTPFHGLMGMLTLLRETGLDARQVDYLRTATEAADHLLAVLNDILDMSQLESGRMTLAPAPVDLRALLREVESLMRPLALAKSLALHLDSDPAVPERVLADATRVKQIVFNLLSNAIKFTEQGAVTLDLRLAGGGTADTAVLEFTVSDTGIGMDDATLAGLFDRFTTGDGQRAQRHAGAGLGMQISRTLARLMGGDIVVRSRPGQGSRFSFRMPLQPLPADAAPPAAEREAYAQRLHLLVAEDQPVNRQYMAALLENLGHDAHFCADGEQAVQVLQRPPGGRRFDIVLMDLHMPVLDGIGATRAIRALADPALSTVPIVALTADAFSDARDRCLIAGMNDFLTKPVSPQKLGSSLRRLFGCELLPEPAGPIAHAEARPVGTAVLVDPQALAMALQAMPRERLAAMVHAFLDQGPQTVQRLRAAMRDAQPLALRVNTHAARGVALNLGLTALAATAEALHEGAAHLPAHEIARLVQRFEDLLALTRKAALDAGLAQPAASADAVAAGAAATR